MSFFWKSGKNASDSKTPQTPIPQYSIRGQNDASGTKTNSKYPANYNEPSTLYGQTAAAYGPIGSDGSIGLDGIGPFSPRKDPIYSPKLGTVQGEFVFAQDPGSTVDESSIMTPRRTKLLALPSSTSNSAKIEIKDTVNDTRVGDKQAEEKASKAVEDGKSPALDTNMLPTDAENPQNDEVGSKQSKETVAGKERESPAPDTKTPIETESGIKKDTLRSEVNGPKLALDDSKMKALNDKILEMLKTEGVRPVIQEEFCAFQFYYMMNNVIQELGKPMFLDTETLEIVQEYTPKKTAVFHIQALGCLLRDPQHNKGYKLISELITICDDIFKIATSGNLPLEAGKKIFTESVKKHAPSAPHRYHQCLFAAKDGDQSLYVKYLCSVKAEMIKTWATGLKFVVLKTKKEMEKQMRLKIQDEMTRKRDAQKHAKFTPMHDYSGDLEPY